MYPRSEILFPHSCIAGLRRLLDEPWERLIDRTLAQDESSDESLAFSLMMIRFCGCLSCDMGSYKASLGCDVCSQRTVAGVKGSSAPLSRRLEKAREELERYRAGEPMADPEA
jgi:hypothetical protein